MVMVVWVAVALCLACISSCAGSVNLDVPLSTARGLPVDAVDPNWTYNFGLKNGPVHVGGPSPWPQFSPYANWVTPPLTRTGSASAGNYLFNTTFELTNYDPSTYVLRANVATDNDLRGVFINDQALALQPPCGESTYNCTVSYELSGRFVAGHNTISFLVHNEPLPLIHPTGIYVEFVI